jgi:hypothetical protein
MKKTRYFIAALALGIGFGAAPVQAQTTAQTLTFSIICQYVTNVFSTNAAAGITNEDQMLTTVLLDSINIEKAIAIDLAGTNWEKDWYPFTIVREVNLTNGNEGIFLRHGTNQTNISERFFGLSFTNEFTSEVPSVFVATNYTTLPIKGGWLYMHPTNSITNYTLLDSLCFVSFASSNIQFNLFGHGQGTEAKAGGYLHGKLYELPTVSTIITGAGTFNLNLTTNIYLTPTTNGTPAFFNGLAHGTLVISAPYYLPIPGP